MQVFPRSNPNSKAALDVTKFSVSAGFHQQQPNPTGSSIRFLPVQQSFVPSDVTAQDIFFNTSVMRPYEVLLSCLSYAFIVKRLVLLPKGFRRVNMTTLRAGCLVDNRTFD